MKSVVIALAAGTLVGSWAPLAFAQAAERAQTRARRHPTTVRSDANPDSSAEDGADARAAATPIEQGGHSSEEPAVRIDSSWSAAEDVPRPAEGETAWKSRLVMPGEFGTWVQAPSALSLTPVPMVGGELALSSRISLIGEGAKDAFDATFSGANAGLRLHLLPADSPLQMSVAGGLTRMQTSVPSDLPRSLDGRTVTWGQFQMTHDAGPWHFAGALRASMLTSEAAAAPTISGSGGVSRDIGSTRVGLEVAFEKDGARSAVIPWIALLRFNERMMLRAGAALPITGGAPPAAFLTLVGEL